MSSRVFLLFALSAVLAAQTVASWPVSGHKKKNHQAMYGQVTGWSSSVEGPGIPVGQSDSVYVIGKDATVSHSGQASAVIKSTTASKTDFRAITQGIRATAYRGKRISLTGFIKTKEVTGWAGLWLRVDGMNKMLGFDNMRNRPITGNTDWTAYTIVLDVPKDAVAIFFGSLLSGNGQVWLDDLSLQIVNSSSVTTTQGVSASKVRTWSLKPQNLDFTSAPNSPTLQPIPGWTTGPKWDAAVKLNQQELRNGKTTACIRIDDGSAGNEHGLYQDVQAGQYRGRRVRFQTFVKTNDVDGEVGAYLVAHAPQPVDDVKAVANEQKADTPSAKLTHDWKPVAVVIDVPRHATGLTFGIALHGSGQVWISEASIEAVDPRKTPITGKGCSDNSFVPYQKKDIEKLPTAPVNLDFER